MKKKAAVVREVIVGGVPVEVTRKAVRGLRLRVRRDGTAALSVPLCVSDGEADRFLREKEEWLRAAVKEIREIRQTDVSLLEEGGRVLLFGRWIPLRIRTVSSARQEGFALDAQGGLLSLCEDSDQKRRQDLFDHYRREALREILEERVPFWEKKTRLKSRKWMIRDMHTRWGSCSVAKRTIRFALKLSERTLPEIDSVVLHELCHLRVPDHGPDFAALMTFHMPSWRACQQSMKKPILP